MTTSEGLPPLVTLVPVSVLAGVGMLLVFRRFSNQAGIRQVRRQLIASLYELRLFAEEPRLVWQAQKRLLIGNMRYLSLLARPALVLAFPMVLLFVQLDAFYGRSALEVGRPAIVTVQRRSALEERNRLPVLETPAGIVVESPAVSVPREHQISWRIRPVLAVSGNLRIVWPEVAFEKSIEAGAGAYRPSMRRTRSLVDWLLDPAEPRLPEGNVEWIGIRYPRQAVGVAGFEFHWAVWFVLISTATALLLKKRLRVAL